jgi:hypothetical protein
MNDQFIIDDLATAIVLAEENGEHTLANLLLRAATAIDWLMDELVRARGIPTLTDIFETEQC